MNEDIIDTQDGYCIWQLVTPFKGRIFAFLRPVSEGVKNYIIVSPQGDNQINSHGLYEDYEMAINIAREHKDALVLPVTSGKFP